MKTLIILSITIFWICTACNNEQAPDNQKPATPKALEDKNAVYEKFSRRDNDLLEILYQELVDNTPELKELEHKIELLTDSQGDTTKVFDNFNRKNQAYYGTANQYIKQMNDSLLKVKMKHLVDNSLAAYNTSITPHQAIIQSIDTKHLTLRGLHKILKITKTLPLLEKYQNDHLPSTKSLEGFSKQLDEAINDADTLIKK